VGGKGIYGQFPGRLYKNDQATGNGSKGTKNYLGTYRGKHLTLGNIAHDKGKYYRLEA
jgi:hypothetical protein